MFRIFLIMQLRRCWCCWCRCWRKRSKRPPRRIILYTSRELCNHRREDQTQPDTYPNQQSTKQNLHPQRILIHQSQQDQRWRIEQESCDDEPSRSILVAAPANKWGRECRDEKGKEKKSGAEGGEVEDGGGAEGEDDVEGGVEEGSNGG